MKSLKEFLQTGDFKGEKHVPVIHVPENIEKDKEFDLRVSIGDEIKHPNTLEHHISWVKVFFKGENNKFPVEIANFNFSAHGESDNSTQPVGITSVKLSKSGTIHALSYCNIHGLWENSVCIEVK
ncbi:MAG: class II SORL domain-containing protein [Tepidibacter sp.]|jgi:superoxide reductase|uniref:class II SORL domain-containing protein n=1 Tax=Tepidibacter sp. TaxID=2529387 RepID=UPI0025CD2B21|nr:class II SORL domain-containing protein [Tepidibacter sp.]MCT4508074.1 class II SORL domain-containing protein [Tepidibacter sp.]